MSMRNHNIVLAFALCTSIPAISMANPQVPEQSDSYVYIAGKSQPCTGVAPQQCMQIRSSANEDWQNYYGSIEGFEFKDDGTESLLKIRKEKIKNPAADQSSEKWVLVDVVTERQPLPALLSPFPEPEKEWARSVIHVPQQVNEEDYKVEIIAGKTLEIDCNHHILPASYKEETVQGWGYDYYVIEPEEGKMISTMMACQGPRKNQFVSTANGPGIVRYNSRLPIVVYTPKDTEVRYRIWKTDTITATADRI
ncbi:MAG: serine protease inhibitor ecotin [Corticimicrobacter sp.]|uniref:serine protease inhibitor ecotin n=1 Tax=Corticimicrobacter sp. TaxID=2678536 RepID=UPI0032DB5E91